MFICKEPGEALEHYVRSYTWEVGIETRGREWNTNKTSTPRFMKLFNKSILFKVTNNSSIKNKQIPSYLLCLSAWMSPNLTWPQ